MNILTYIESRNGKIRPAGLEAASLGRKLADLTGGKLFALLIASGMDEAEKLKNYGVDNILIADHRELQDYSPEGYREAVVNAVQENDIKVVILTATAMGRDLAPTVAGNLDCGLLPDCISADYTEGRISVTRPVYAGRVIAEFSAAALPVVVSIRPKAFLIKEREGASAEISKLELDLDDKIRAKLIETTGGDSGKLDVAEADVIVAGGRGMREKDNFGLIEELATLLNGAVGASRAVVDTDWRPHSEQIGQTGKVVSATLYFAVGISGAIQHLAGMRTSKVIVAVNKDSEAPIFKSADYGIVGDAMEVLPAITKAIRASE